MLTLTAVSLSWQKPRPYSSFIFASLGLLIKPTSVVVLLLNVLKNDTFMATIKSRVAIKDIIWGVASIVVALLYYVFALKYIGRFEVHNHFNVDMQNPITQLISFFSSNDPMSLEYLFSVRLLCPPYIVWLVPGLFNLQVMLMPYLGLTLFILGMFFYLIAKWEVIAWRAIIVFVVQLLAIATLDGEHSFVHFYYYVGTTFALSIVFIGYLTKIWTWYKPFLILILLLQFADILNFEIGDYFTRHFQWSAQSRVAFYDECSSLKSRHLDWPWDKGYVFNAPDTDNGQTADLGICFGEREKLNGAQYGFYYNWDSIPQNCSIVDQSEHINLVTCK